MINDIERRKVAAKLRELGVYVFDPDNTYELLADALGVDDFEGTDELFNRLADLIEPDTTTDTTKTAPDTTKCDRDALMELADEIDRKSNDGTVNPDPMRPLATSLDLFGYARRIREACGEVGR